MPIGIALVRLPRLLSDLVAAAFVADDAWFELVDHETDIDLPGTVQHPRPDVVIAKVDDPWKADVADLLTQCPELVVLGVRGDSSSARQGGDGLRLLRAWFSDVDTFTESRRRFAQLAACEAP